MYNINSSICSHVTVCHVTLINMTCLGLGDLLFEEATVDTERQKKVEDKSHSLQEIYVVKECSPQWFMKPDSCHSNEEHVILKYQADLCYYSGDYENAAVRYNHFLDILPTTHSQLRKEVIDSLVRCYLKCNQTEKGFKWAELLVTPPHDKDHTSWQLLADCYQQLQHITDETICRQRCVLLSRHYPLYWINLYYTYTRLMEYPLKYDKQISMNIVKLFKPYLKRYDGHTKLCYEYELFMKLMSQQLDTFNNEEWITILRVSSCGSLIWANQLLSYSVQHSTSFAVSSQSKQLMKVKTLINSFHDNLVSHLSQNIKTSVIDI